MALLALVKGMLGVCPVTGGRSLDGCGVVTHDDARCNRASEPQGPRGVQDSVERPEVPRETGVKAKAARGPLASVTGDPRQYGGSQGNRTTISGPGFPRGVGDVCPQIGSTWSSATSIRSADLDR